MFFFPAIKTTRTWQEQLQKVSDEIQEVINAKSSLEIDKEVIDVFHATETLMRLRFKDRQHDLDVLLADTKARNKKRGYYDATIF